MAVLLYFLLNYVLRVQLRILPLLLCAACSLFVGMALPRIIVRYSDWLGALAVLAVFSLIFSYFLAYYEEKLDRRPKVDGELCLGEPMVLAMPESAAPDRRSDPVALYIPAAGTPVSKEKATGEALGPELDPGPAGHAGGQAEAPVFPDSFEQQLELAFQLKERQDYLAAAGLFKQILDANPGSQAAPLVTLQIADSLKQAGDFPEASALLADSLDAFAIAGGHGLERQFRALLSEIQRLQDFEKTGGSNL
ncbi:MAG: tetratricopeptide repeat protein [Sporomusaceae bacterium]|nr:tetratricopeptide repeat protein [Sporomusaceae bacterium]